MPDFVTHSSPEDTNSTLDLKTPPQTAARGRPSWGRIAVWGGLVLLLAIVGWGLLKSQQGSAVVGHRAPGFTLTTFDNQQISLQSLKGKVVVLNFWASWCIPCSQEAADLETAWKYYEPRGDVVFLGADWTDTEDEASAYLKKYAITYQNGPDLGTRIAQAYRMTGVPETYVIDQNGVLAYKQIGPFTSLNEIKAAIDPLLKP